MTMRAEFLVGEREVDLNFHDAQSASRSGCILTLPSSVGQPEFIPVAIGPGFDQRGQMP